MGNAVIIPENLMALSQAVAIAGSEASSSMAATNLLSEAPSKFWRSTSSAPSHTYFYGYVKNFTFPVSALALVGHNLSRGDQYRIFINNSSSPISPIAGYTQYLPTSTVAGVTTNTASGFADVDNGETTPGATFATPTTPASVWSLCVGFNTPSTAPEIGTDLQAFWVYVKCQSDLPAVGPSVTVSLYESGVLKQTIGTKILRSTTGQWMCFPWNASLLATASGANVECRVSCTPVSGAQYVSVGSIVWACDDASRTADSGWLTYTPFVGTGDVTYKPEVEGRGNVLLHQFSTTYNPRFVHVMLRQSSAPSDIDRSLEIPPTVPGYVQIGVLVVGELWQPAINMSYGKLAGVVDSSPRRRTYGGGMFGSRRPTRRAVSLALGHATTVEAHTVLDRVLWRHGLMKPFVVSTTPDDATQSKATTLFGHIRNAENWLNIQPDEGYENNFSLEFEEVL